MLSWSELSVRHIVVEGKWHGSLLTDARVAPHGMSKLAPYPKEIGFIYDTIFWNVNYNFPG